MGRPTIIGAIFVLAACAVPTTGVVPRGDGMYTVTRQGEGAWVTVGSRYDRFQSPTVDVEIMKAKRRIDAENELRRRDEASGGNSLGGGCIYTPNWSNC